MTKFPGYAVNYAVAKHGSVEVGTTECSDYANAKLLFDALKSDLRCIQAELVDGSDKTIEVFPS